MDRFTKYKTPPIFFEVFGYDTFNILYEATKRGGMDSEGVRRGLLSINGLPAAAGTITVQPNREVVFPVVLRQIKKGQWLRLINNRDA